MSNGLFGFRRPDGRFGIRNYVPIFTYQRFRKECSVILPGR